MNSYFWLDGMCCADYGINLQGPVGFDSPTLKTTSISIPGRNGDLHIDEGAFNNLTGRANCFALQEGVEQALFSAAKWLLLHSGYRRLETSEEPDYYRLACVTNGPEIAIRMRLLAPFSINFDCQPQRFFKSGERAITLQTQDTLYNIGFPALPLIKINGSGGGNLYIGNYKVQILELTDYIVLDSETQNAYRETQNKNNAISTDNFPILQSGENMISWDGQINSIEITPRWWTI